MAQKNDKQMSTETKTALAIAAAAAAAAGAYFFYGSKDAAKNRKALKGWMVKARGEVMEKVENLRDLTKENYDRVVAQVMDKYKKMKSIDPKELAALSAELKASWDKIAGHAKKATTPRKAASKRVTSKKK